MEKIYDTEQTDQTLTVRLKKGEIQAFEILYDRYLNYVKTIVERTGNQFLSVEDKEEVVADVFLSLWQHAEQIDSKRTTLKPYLAVIAKNTVINRMKKRSKSYHITVLSEEIKGKTNPALQHVIAQELQNIVMEALSLLSQLDIECFLRYYYYSMTIQEIAETLHINESTVKSKLARGRKRLRKILEERGISSEDIYF